ncbi:MAG: hypothetical protein FJY97_15485 [candidate division Zixibacteria bacterium]|nr:hypothetical protein [candidate division Zixibacteria bacterium]
MSDTFYGVRIDGGVAPFRIVQQNADGYGTMTFQGRWRYDGPAGTVQLRIVREDDARVVAGSTDWQDAGKQDTSTWSHSFVLVPAGGLYRVETRLVVDRNNAEWSPHGDTVHHVGVGDLWIIAGQSNAAGYGRGPVFDPPELGVHILKNDETWDIAAHPLNDTTRSTHPNLEGANPGHSAYLRFAKDLKTTLGYPIGLIQTALGGSPLSQWNPEENPEAPLYRNLLHCVGLAGGRAKGMVWYQGESDCGMTLAPSYEQRFAQFVTRLRNDMTDPDFPVIVAQLNRYTAPQDVDGHRAWSIIREAQRRVETLGHAAAVPATDLGISDLIHTSSDGNLVLGSRKARAALGMVYGRDIAWRAADVVSAIAIDETTVELAFDHVHNRLAFLGPGHQDFTVEDEAGFAPVVAAETPTRDRVRLLLDRPLQGAAHAHGAFGSFPTVNLRDAETNQPPLGFYNLPVKRSDA